GAAARGPGGEGDGVPRQERLGGALQRGAGDARRRGGDGGQGQGDRQDVRDRPGGPAEESGEVSGGREQEAAVPGQGEAAGSEGAAGDRVPAERRDEGGVAGGTGGREVRGYRGSS